MSEQVLTEWLSSPETQRLVRFLRAVQTGTVRTFLAGQPVDPMMQGRAAAYSDLEKLLALPADKVSEEFNRASKELNK